MTKSTISICLSGGGYRATLFEYGSLKRLNELGILSQVDTISSVSGGSLLSACFADFLLHGSPVRKDGVYSNFSEYVGGLVQQLCSTDLRTGAALSRAKIGKGDSVNSLVKKLDKILTPTSLSELEGTKKQFVFCATDLMYGVLWEMGNKRVGSYAAGYIDQANSTWSTAKAAAVSACFPPVFDPFPVGEDSGNYVPSGIGLDEEAFSNSENRALREDMHLTDGGVYDNLGLEPVFPFDSKDSSQGRTILAIDGGKPFYADDDAASAGLGRLAQYNSIMSKQVHALRIRYFIKARKHRDISGAYWGIQQWPEKHLAGAAGYSEDLAKSVLANVRTDMDEFSPDEQAVLIKHGYEVADASIRKRAENLLPKPLLALSALEGRISDESAVRESLRDSHKRVYVDFLSNREHRNNLIG